MDRFRCGEMGERQVSGMVTQIRRNWFQQASEIMPARLPECRNGYAHSTI